MHMVIARKYDGPYIVQIPHETVLIQVYTVRPFTVNPPSTQMTCPVI